MKTITYTVAKSEAIRIKADYKKILNKTNKVLAMNQAIFNQLKRDGLVTIIKEADDFYTFEDHAGDCYCPIAHDYIDPKVLKKQKRKERARTERLGFFVMVLKANDHIIDSIGGFCGNDFYGSGYDYEFYETAINTVSADQKNYITEIKELLA